MRACWPILGVVLSIVACAPSGAHDDAADWEQRSSAGTEPDADADGLSDRLEAQLGTDPELADTDGDGISDAVEVGTAPSRVDTDGDGVIDALASDSDGDGVPDAVEGVGDPDTDDVPSFRDLDSDGDGVSDRAEGLADSDGDTTADRLDLDSDADGLSDRVEGNSDPDADGLANRLDLDSDGDGVPDTVEAADDRDGDGLPNFLDIDADGDGVSDGAESSEDHDSDGLPDFLDLDSDSDGMSDAAEAEAGDVDSDGDGRADRQDGDADDDGLNDGFRPSGGGGCASSGVGGLSSLMLASAALWRRRRRWMSVAGLAALGLPAAAATTVRDGGFEVERLRPPLDSAGILDTDVATVTRGGTWGVWHTGSIRPLVLTRFVDDTAVGTAELVSHRLGVTVAGAYAFHPRLTVGVQIPTVVSQGRSAPSSESLAGFPATMADASLGDVRVAGKWSLGTLTRAGIDTAALLSITLPTGSVQAFAGEVGPSVEPGLAVSRSWDNVVGALNLGYRVRPVRADSTLWPGSELLWRVAGRYRWTPAWALQAGLSGSSSTLAAAAAPVTGLEALGGFLWTGGPWTVAATVGTGLVAGLGVPTARWGIDFRYTGASVEKYVPTAPTLSTVDADGDTVFDDVDKCPKAPETWNGFEDRDGCPDTLPSASSAAPGSPRPVSKEAPASPMFDPDSIAAGTLVAVPPGIGFVPGREQLLKKSSVAMDALAAQLQAHPEWRMVAIRVRAPSDGRRELTMQLARGRAKAIVEALRQRGVAADRLTSKGLEPDAETAGARKLEYVIEIIAFQ